MKQFDFEHLLYLVESTQNLQKDEYIKHIINGCVSFFDTDEEDIEVGEGGEVPPPSFLKSLYILQIQLFHQRSLKVYEIHFRSSSETKEITYSDLRNASSDVEHGAKVFIVDDDDDGTIKNRRVDFSARSNSLVDVFEQVKSFMDKQGGNEGGEDEPEPWNPNGPDWKTFEKEDEKYHIIGARRR